MMYAVQEAIDEFTARFTHHVGRAPSDDDMLGAVERFNARYQLRQGVAREDLEAFFAAETLPPIPDPPPPPTEKINTTQAEQIVRDLWLERYGVDQPGPALGRIPAVLIYAQCAIVTGWGNIDRADFEHFARWWVKARQGT